MNDCLKQKIKDVILMWKQEKDLALALDAGKSYISYIDGRISGLDFALVLFSQNEEQSE